MTIESGERSRSHGLSLAVLEAQADAVGIPIRFQAGSWNEYESRFRENLKEMCSRQISWGVFGAIDFDENREWIKSVCLAEGVSPAIPLWKEDRTKLLKEFLERGFRAELVAVKDGVLSPDLLGRELDARLISELESQGVDLSGETGEYHTVVVDGPLFRSRLKTQHGKRVIKDGYWFSDVSLC